MATVAPKQKGAKNYVWGIPTFRNLEEEKGQVKEIKSNNLQGRKITTGLIAAWDPKKDVSRERFSRQLNGSENSRMIRNDIFLLIKNGILLNH